MSRTTSSTNNKNTNLSVDWRSVLVKGERTVIPYMPGPSVAQGARNTTATTCLAPVGKILPSMATLETVGRNVPDHSFKMYQTERPNQVLLNN